VGNPLDDPGAFDAFEAAGWEGNAVAYERLFGVVTDRVVAPLLAIASVGVGARVLDVATGPGWVAAHATEQRSRNRACAVRDAYGTQQATAPHS
jgi:hypothetical protein